MAYRPWELTLIDSPETVERLWDAKNSLATAWQYDCGSLRNYPINTSFAVARITQSIAGQSAVIKPKLPKWKTPRTLSELLPEESVKIIWEDYNSGNFEDAIRSASEVRSTKKSQKAFRTIIRAIEAAYLALYLGLDVLGMPKINILHLGCWIRHSNAEGLRRIPR
jgi:hypothetical protein